MAIRISSPNIPTFRSTPKAPASAVVINGAYRLTPNHKILFKNTYTHDADKNTRQFAGFDGGTGSDLSSTRLRYVERSLFSQR